MASDVNELVKSIRKGAIFQEERRQAAKELGQLFDDAALVEAANNLRTISVGEADFVTFDRLQREEMDFWEILNQALTTNGHPPATTLKEAMNGIGKPTPEQIGRWYGEEAFAHIKENFDANSSYSIKMKYADILGAVGGLSAIGYLRTLMDDTNDAVRRNAANALGNIPLPASLEILLQSLNNEQGIESMRAITLALGSFDDAEAIYQLKQLSQTQKDSFARVNAGISLIKLGQVDYVAGVMNKHSNKDVQRSAANAMAQSENTEAVIPYLLEAIEKHTDFMVRIAAVRRLGELQEESAFDTIAQVVKTGSFSLKKAATDAIVNYGERAIEPLSTRMGDVDMPEWAVKQKQPTISQRAKNALETIGTTEALDIVARWED